MAHSLLIRPFFVLNRVFLLSQPGSLDVLAEGSRSRIRIGGHGKGLSPDHAPEARGSTAKPCAAVVVRGAVSHIQISRWRVGN